MEARLNRLKEMIDDVQVSINKTRNAVADIMSKYTNVDNNEVKTDNNRVKLSIEKDGISLDYVRKVGDGPRMHNTNIVYGVDKPSMVNINAKLNVISSWVKTILEHGFENSYYYKPQDITISYSEHLCGIVFSLSNRDNITYVLTKDNKGDNELIVLRGFDPVVVVPLDRLYIPKLQFDIDIEFAIRMLTVVARKAHRNREVYSSLTDHIFHGLLVARSMKTVSHSGIYVYDTPRTVQMVEDFIQEVYEICNHAVITKDKDNEIAICVYNMNGNIKVMGVLFNIVDGKSYALNPYTAPKLKDNELFRHIEYDVNRQNKFLYLRFNRFGTESNVIYHGYAVEYHDVVNLELIMKDILS